MKKDPIMAAGLCRNFCRYYKPGKNEDLACEGYRVVERLLSEGRPISFVKAEFRRDPEMKESLVREVCARCPFRADGCDFMQDRSSPACGGLVLLEQMLASGIVTIDDIGIS